MWPVSWIHKNISFGNVNYKSQKYLKNVPSGFFWGGAIVLMKLTLNLGFQGVSTLLHELVYNLVTRTL